MTSTNTFYSLTPTIVAVAIMIAIHYAAITSMRDIPAIGKPVKNAEMSLKLKCMSIMAQMNIISKNLRIRQHLCLLVAQSVKRLLVWDMMVTPYIWGNTIARNARQPCDDFLLVFRRTKVQPQFAQVR